MSSTVMSRCCGECPYDLPGTPILPSTLFPACYEVTDDYAPSAFMVDLSGVLSCDSCVGAAPFTGVLVTSSSLSPRFMIVASAGTSAGGDGWINAYVPVDITLRAFYNPSCTGSYLDRTITYLVAKMQIISVGGVVTARLRLWYPESVSTDAYRLSVFDGSVAIGQCASNFTISNALSCGTLDSGRLAAFSGGTATITRCPSSYGVEALRCNGRCAYDATTNNPPVVVVSNNYGGSPTSIFNATGSYSFQSYDPATCTWAWSMTRFDGTVYRLTLRSYGDSRRADRTPCRKWGAELSDAAMTMRASTAYGVGLPRQHGGVAVKCRDGQLVGQIDFDSGEFYHHIEIGTP